MDSLFFKLNHFIGSLSDDERKDYFRIIDFLQTSKTSSVITFNNNTVSIIGVSEDENKEKYTIPGDIQHYLKLFIGFGSETVIAPKKDFFEKYIEWSNRAGIAPCLEKTFYMNVLASGLICEENIYHTTVFVYHPGKTRLKIEKVKFENPINKEGK